MIDPEQLNYDVLSVTAITEQVQGVLRVTFDDVWVRGEVSQPRTPRSGHMYLTLKDEDAVLPAVVWRSTLVRLPFQPDEGDDVLVRGYIDVYPPHGRYQFIVRHMEPLGAGALQRKFAQLKAKLSAEGLFALEAKQQLPSFPRRIALITSKTGAAVRDMIKVIHRRFPPVTLVLIPVRVQGAMASGEIARAIHRADRLKNFDAIIVGRGGGSIEDLWAFNEEVVVRAIFDCNTPIISAVGHESDVTIADLVADVRAATPSHAGELAVPDWEEIVSCIENAGRRMARGLRYIVDVAWQRIEALGERPVLRDPRRFTYARRDRLNALGHRLRSQSPKRRVIERASRVEDLASRLALPLRRRLAYERESLAHLQHRLDVLAQQSLPRKLERLEHMKRRLTSLSPTAILKRGYSITSRVDSSGAQHVVRGTEDVSPGDSLITRLGDGSAVPSRVEDQAS